jgi:hypothetical protein
MFKPIQLIHTLEDDSTLLKYRLKQNSLLIWPIVRHDIITNLLNDKNTLGYPSLNNKIKFGLVLKTIIRSFILNPFLIKRGLIIFFNSGVTNIKLENNKYFNRVTDDFYFFNPNNSVLIEDTCNRKLVYPRVHNKAYANLPLIIISKIVNKLFIKFTKEDINEIELICKEIEKKINFQISINTRLRLKKIIFYNCKQYLSSYFVYQQYLRIKKPKLIFVEDGSYGNRSYIIKAANKLNIPTAELQHGFVNENHIAYNFGKSMFENKEVHEYFPQYLLMYGAYWSEMINTISNKFLIGNPYLTNSVEKLNIQKKPNRILFISSGITVDETNEFVNNLVPVSEKLKMEIYFRPHPLEKDSILEKYSNLLDNGVHIDDNNNIYISFAEANYIIGETSTAIFEAASINDNIFLFMSNYTKTYLNDKIKFIKVDSENIESIFEKKSISSKDKNDYYWATDWEKNYSDFLKNILK